MARKKSAKKKSTRKPAAKKKTAKFVKKKTSRGAKKGAAKKAAKKKSPAKKKAVTRKKTVTRRKTSAKKKAPVKKKTSAKKKAPARKQKTARKPAAAKPKKTVSEAKARPRKSKAKQLSRKELKEYRQLLLNIRDAVVDDISFLKGDNLNHSARDSTGDLSGYSIHMADQGTDNFDREFALNMVSSEHDILYEIDEALRRIDNGTFGICEHTGKPIEKPRLKVIPYTRYCVAAQSEMEKGRTRYRPFGPTLSQSTMS